MSTRTAFELTLLALLCVEAVELHYVLTEISPTYGANVEEVRARLAGIRGRTRTRTRRAGIDAAIDDILRSS